MFVCLPVLAVFQNPQSTTRIVNHRCLCSLMHTKQAPANASISTQGPFPPVSCFPMASSPGSVLGPGHLVAKFFSITFAYSPSSLSLLPIQRIVLWGMPGASGGIAQYVSPPLQHVCITDSAGPEDLGRDHPAGHTLSPGSLTGAELPLPLCSCRQSQIRFIFSVIKHALRNEVMFLSSHSCLFYFQRGALWIPWSAAKSPQNRMVQTSHEASDSTINFNESRVLRCQKS